MKNDLQDNIPQLPLWPENQTQDTSKTLPRRPHYAPRGPKTLQDAPKTAPGRLQDDPKTSPRCFKILSRRPQDGSKPPKKPQNASKTPQDAPRRLQDASRRLQTSILGDFWSMFGPFLIDFGLIFAAFLVFFELYFLFFRPSAVAGSPLCGALDIYKYIYKYIHTCIYKYNYESVILYLWIDLKVDVYVC